MSEEPGTEGTKEGLEVKEESSNRRRRIGLRSAPPPKRRKPDKMVVLDLTTDLRATESRSLQRRSRRGNLQLGLTEALLENVGEYVRRELAVAEIEKKISEVVIFAKGGQERKTQEDRLIGYLEDYISALLR